MTVMAVKSIIYFCLFVTIAHLNCAPGDMYILCSCVCCSKVVDCVRRIECMGILLFFPPQREL